MKVEKTEFKDLFIIEPKLHFDSRGYFKETFNDTVLSQKLGFNLKFCQDNIVKSSKNVIRGLHYQTEKYSQSKLIQVVSGSILDVVIDIRDNSKNYLKYFKIELSAKNSLLLFIPKGFAHGYLALEDNTIVHYKVDTPYMKNFEAGINFKDPRFNIDWGIEEEDIIISKKDLNLNFLDVD